MAPSIVVFDGECGLCNGFVAWLITHDREGRFLLAGSAGAVGKDVIAAAGLNPDIAQSTIVLWDGVAATTQSTAVIEIMRGLPWPWRTSVVALVVPRAVRDAIYRWVAKRRSRVIAEDAACGVPPPELTNLWRSRLATARDIAHVRGEGGPR
jgi:predicted DCC family thiol-disulfide oxidoreductase YuxK